MSSPKTQDTVPHSQRHRQPARHTPQHACTSLIPKIDIPSSGELALHSAPSIHVHDMHTHHALACTRSTHNNPQGPHNVPFTRTAPLGLDDHGGNFQEVTFPGDILNGQNGSGQEKSSCEIQQKDPGLLCCGWDGRRRRLKVNNNTVGT